MRNSNILKCRDILSLIYVLRYGTCKFVRFLATKWLCYVVCLFRFQQYEAIQHPYSVIKIPDDILMEVACLVPCSGITAYNAVTQCKDSIDIEIQITGY